MTRSPAVVRRSAIGAGAVGLAFVGVLLVSILAGSHQWTGLVLLDPQSPGTLLDAVKVVTEANNGLVTLATIALGAVAFVITYHREKRVDLSPAAMAYLAAAVVLLVGTMLAALLANELVFTMIGRNAIDLSLPALGGARRSAYALLILGMAAVGLFALDVMTTAKQGAVESEKP